MNLSLRERFRFFFRHAAYAEGERARGALELARAEAWAAEHDWHVNWEADDDGDMGDHELWCAKARRRAAAHALPAHVWERLPEPEQLKLRGAMLRHGDCAHCAELCTVTTPDGEQETLGGILDASCDYRRVVAAELALQLVEAETAAYRRLPARQCASCNGAGWRHVESMQRRGELVILRCPACRKYATDTEARIAHASGRCCQVEVPLPPELTPEYRS